MSISRDGHTAIVTGGAARNPKQMVLAADRLKGPLKQLGSSQVGVSLTGASGMWSDFNAANRSAMMKSELFSWPVTLAILALAFGSLVAASLPLMLTIVGLVASAGVLYLGTLFADISIWSMNFALMFALALGIDYALFIVVRYRAAHFGHGMTPADAAGVAMDTAGKAVLFSGVTVLISLSAVHARAEPRVPLDGARDHGRGRLHPRRDAHAAAGRARRARPEGRQPLAQVGALRRAPLTALRPLGRTHLGQAAALRRPRPARPARPRRSRCSV